ncbi:MAG: hypothetical protein EOO04_17330 [Chitinophagaceae bacterium]|nr:MAG: hypothetical protein EOO04_17330 [Chitinophagaceae bacterium]
MKTAAILLLMFLFAATITTGQNNIKYHAQNYVGLLEGEARGAFQLQTIHGIQYRNWYGAGGVGLDYYKFRSIPVFFSLNRDIVLKNRTFFVSGDIGTNYPWVQDMSTTVWGNTTRQDFSPGLYWSGGLGYKAYFKNKSDAILVNLGYSFKHLTEENRSEGFCIDPPCTVNVTRFDYRLNRISLRLGWQF